MTNSAVYGAIKEAPHIVDLRTFLIPSMSEAEGAGKQEHWLTHTEVANPMSKYGKYKSQRTSWGVDVIEKFWVEIETSDGSRGFAVGGGGFIGCFLAEKHFKRFFIGADPRDVNLLWDQMYRASQHYGRKGLTVMIISVIDLALWDLLGKIRNEPVYKMIGGQTKEFLHCYFTGPHPEVAKENGFWGGKVPLPFGPEETDSIPKNYDVLRTYREKVGPNFPLMVDCYMSGTVPYAIELVSKSHDLKIEWWEEFLHPDDSDGYALLKRALPQVKWTTGEHEYTRYGFRKLIEGRNIDIIQPDVMWCGGLTELLKIAAMAAAYDIPVVPHATGLYSCHFIMSQTNSPIIEYAAHAPDGKSVAPTYGNLFLNEPIPTNGKLRPSDFSGPGFGLKLNPDVKLVPAREILQALPHTS